MWYIISRLIFHMCESNYSHGWKFEPHIRVLPLRLLSIGPTCVGKRRTYLALKAAFGEKIENIETGELGREKCKNDPVFKAKNEPYMAAGELIPDEEILPVARQRVLEIQQMPMVTIHYFDGIPRKVSQGNYLLENDIIDPQDSLALILHASMDTCHQRFDHRYQNKTGGDRIDCADGDYKKAFDLFRRRYIAHQEEMPLLLGWLSAVGIPVIHIDANDAIEVFPGKVVLQTKTFWGRRLHSEEARGGTELLNLPPQRIVQRNRIFQRAGFRTPANRLGI
jgi:adenylate kinase family enzyme